MLNKPVPHCVHKLHEGIVHVVEQHIVVSEAVRLVPGHTSLDKHIAPPCAEHVCKP